MGYGIGNSFSCINFIDDSLDVYLKHFYVCKHGLPFVLDGSDLILFYFIDLSGYPSSQLSH